MVFFLAVPVLIGAVAVLAVVVGSWTGLLPKLTMQNLIVVGLGFLVVMMLMKKIPVNRNTIILTAVIAAIGVLLVFFK